MGEILLGIRKHKHANQGVICNVLFKDEKHLSVKLVRTADHAFLTEGGVFSKEMFSQWVDYKRQSEYFAVRNGPHPYEMSLYFDV